MGKWVTIPSLGVPDASSVNCAQCHLQPHTGSYRYGCVHIPMTSIRIRAAYMPVIYIDSVADRCECGCNNVTVTPVDGVFRMDDYRESPGWDEVMRYATRASILNAVREVVIDQPHCGTCFRAEVPEHTVGTPDDFYSVCDYCRITYHATCEMCETTLATSSVYPLNMSDGSIQHTCQSCSYRLVMCSHCSLYHGADDSCCEEDYDGYVSGCHCESCDDSDSREIHNYSFRPRLRFHAVGPEKRTAADRYGTLVDRTPYMGFEIEYEVEGRHDRYRVARHALELFGSRRVYCKEDGSIHDGFELVSHPATLEWWMSEFNWAGFRELRAGREIASRDNCGFHIHVSKAGFSSPAHEYRWMLMFFRNQKYVTALAGRTSSYAEFSMSNRALLAEIAKGKTGSPERYSVINSQNEHTHEVRIFASTPFVNRIKAALQFVESTVEYTRNLASAKVLADGGFSWDEYVSWLVERGPRYRQLLKRIDDTCRGLYIPTAGQRREARVTVGRNGRAINPYSENYTSSEIRSFVTQEGKKA